MRYPPQFIDRVRQHFRLSEVIGQRMTLKRSGREFMGLCPFHGEKTPSFTVNDEKGFFHCFGCGAHGDVIGFVKDYDKLSYPQAVETLARQAGISLPQMTPAQQKQMDRADTLYAVMEAAANWFCLQLRQIGGAEARDYLARRGLKEDTWREFRIGFAPSRRSGLKDAMLQKGLSEAQLLEAGLLTRLEDGSSYDKFRGRIIFPITDSGGRVIAFGGRLIDPDAKGPKYLNSPDTPLFKKSYNLYHLDMARRAGGKAGTILVAEGYMDVIALAQAGFDHAVAPLGTAITREQLGLLWQVVDEPVLCLDGDTAGWRAMERALELALPLLTPGKSLSFVRLPQGEDPDSLVLSHGAAAMERLIAQRQPLVEVLWQKYFTARPLTTPEQQAGAEREIMRAVEAIKDNSVREHYRQAVRERLWDARRSRTRKGSRKPETAGSASALALRTTRTALLGPQQQRERGREECYRALIPLICHYPNLLDAGLEEQLSHITLNDPSLEAVRNAMLDAVPEALEGREAFHRSMTQTLGDRSWSAICANGAALLPKGLLAQDESTGIVAAEEHLQRIQHRLEILTLEEERHAAESAFAQSMDEKHLERLEALNRRLQEVQNSQTFFPEIEL